MCLYAIQRDGRLASKSNHVAGLKVMTLLIRGLEAASVLTEVSTPLSNHDGVVKGLEAILGHQILSS